MAVSTVAHLNFTGAARQALEFYHSVFGGQLMIATYGQVGVPQDSADSDTAVFSPLAPDSPDAERVSDGLLHRPLRRDLLVNQWWCVDIGL